MGASANGKSWPPVTVWGAKAEVSSVHLMFPMINMYSLVQFAVSSVLHADDWARVGNWSTLEGRDVV